MALQLTTIERVQIILDVPIRDPVLQNAILSSIDYRLSDDFSITAFNFSTKFFIFKDMILSRDNFGAVFDLVQFANVLFRIITNHIDFASTESQFKNVAVRRKRSRRFQKHDIFYHSTSNVFKYLLASEFALFATKRDKFSIFHEDMRERLSLTIAHSRLRKHDIFFRLGNQVFTRKIDD